MTLPWLPWPRTFAMDPRVRVVSLAARGLFYDLASASDDHGSVWVPEGHGWIDVCATLSGRARTEVEPCAEQLRRVGLVEHNDREIYLPDVARWREGLQGAPAPASEGGSPSASVRDPRALLRVHFSNRKLRSAEARRAWLATDAAAKVLARLGLDRATAEAVADRAGQRGGQFTAGNQAARKNGSKEPAETAVSNGGKLTAVNGGKPAPSLTLSPQEKERETEEKHTTPRAGETAVRNGGKAYSENGGKPAALMMEPAALVALLGQQPKGPILLARDSRTLARGAVVLRDLAEHGYREDDYRTLLAWLVAGGLRWRRVSVPLAELFNDAPDNKLSLPLLLEQARAWHTAGRPAIKDVTWTRTRVGAAPPSTDFDDTTDPYAAQTRDPRS